MYEICAGRPDFQRAVVVAREYRDVLFTRTYPAYGWGPKTTITVQARDGRQWTIDRKDFEQRVLYSFNDGKTWLPERHRKVRNWLVEEYNRAEAALDQQAEKVDGLRWKLERNKLDPERRRNDIERLLRAIDRPCSYSKPGRGREQWLSDRVKTEDDLRRLKEGRTPRSWLQGE